METGAAERYAISDADRAAGHVEKRKSGCLLDRFLEKKRVQSVPGPGAAQAGERDACWLPQKLESSDLSSYDSRSNLEPSAASDSREGLSALGWGSFPSRSTTTDSPGLLTPAADSGMKSRIQKEVPELAVPVPVDDRMQIGIHVDSKLVAITLAVIGARASIMIPGHAE